MTCFTETGSCIELRVSRGNSVSLLYLALACNAAWCQTDHSQEDWPSSLASGKKKKEMLLTLRLFLSLYFFFLFFFLAGRFRPFVGFSSTWSHFFHMKPRSCHLPHESKKGTLLLPRRLTCLSVETPCTELRDLFFSFNGKHISLMIAAAQNNFRVHSRANKCERST